MEFITWGKEWNALIDRYLLDGVMSSEEWEKLDDSQKIVINEIKKAFKRINKREILTIHHSLQ
jgi:hypothetical protein